MRTCRMPVHELLIDPVAGTDLIGTPSYIADEYAVPLGRADMLWYFGNGTRHAGAPDDPRLAVVGKADLHGLPPTTVISAEIDPLESDGRFLTGKLQAHGRSGGADRVWRDDARLLRHGPGGGRAREAEAFAAQQLDATFDKIGNPPAPRPEQGRRPAPRRRPPAVHRVRGS